MKIKSTSVKGIVAFALIAIATLQILWLYSVYHAYHESILLKITDNLKQSIEDEFLLRRKKIGGPFTSTFYPVEKDSADVRNFILVTADTTYTIPYNSANRYNDSKARHTAFKYILPLNIDNLDSIFNQSLLQAHVPARYTVIEMIDKDKNETKQTHPSVHSLSLQNFETETFWLDLADSVGIKAYVQVPYDAILRQLALILILSLILITGVAISLFRLSQTILRQHKAERVKKDFVNAMTHELKRPIVSSLFTMEFLQDHINKNETQSNSELLENSILSLKKLDSYVEKIQEISQGEEGNIKLEKEMISLTSFFHDLKNKYESEQGKKVTIQLKIEEEINLMTDPIHFSNVMDNLTENSIKYSDETVNIDIKVFRKNGNVHIHHRDNGWGIPLSEINHIFDKFYRGISVEKRRKKGFGLGLSYVKSMIEQLGGRISVTSREKEFTEFILIHPL